MFQVDDRTGLEIIPLAECLTLLGTHSVGRLGVVVAGRPGVFPVNYVLDGRDIVFRTPDGTKLWGARGHPVAFEIDSTDVAARTGWSVVVSGYAEEITTRSEIERLRTLGLRPWTTGPAEHWMRIHPHSVTGRRIPRALRRPGTRSASRQHVVSSLPIRPVVALAEDASLAEVGDAMLRARVTVVAVGDQLLTEHDLARAVGQGFAGGDPAAKHCGERELVLSASASPAEALQVMLAVGVHHVVVVDASGTLGTVALSDVLGELLAGDDLPAWVPALRLALHVTY
jgi:nitroimidazol reductase NimA-like FMN-containing flavoprotein (pyridoxamine 5'-phosphate oxidase superfamily)/CBS domain-containing protein